MRIRSAVFTAFSIAAATVVVAVAPASAGTINNNNNNSTVSHTMAGSAGIRVNSVGSAGIRVNGIRVNFAAQARGAGLTSAQASALQAKVDSYLVKTGGIQVAANKIDLGGKGVLVLTVPGESHVRDLSVASASASAASVSHSGVSGNSIAAPAYSCAYYHFCAFDQTGWAGNVLDWFYCGTYTMPWFTTGSFEDHQSGGTVSTFNTTTGSFPVTAPLDDIDIDWAPVLSIGVC